MVEQVQAAFDTLKETYATQETKTYEWRSGQLQSMFKGVTEMNDEFCEAMRLDLGRDLFLNYVAEVLFLQAGIKHDGTNLKNWMKDVPEEIELLLMPGQAITRYEPLGVVGVFGSWNAPFITTLKPMVQAITAGNCVIVKPSEFAPASSACMKKFVEKYCDSKAVVCIEGAVDVAVALNNLNLDLICFTGSTQVGKIIAQTAAKNLTPCILELGGKCPLIVDHTAAMDFSASKIAFGKTINSGQICIAPDYIFVHESRVKEFVEAVQVKFKQMYGEKPEGSEFQGKMITDFHVDRVKKLIDTAGGKIVCGGNVNKEVKHIEPTIILQPSLDSPLMKEEIFGPVMPIFPYKDIREVVKFINARDKPLAIYYFGQPDSYNATMLHSETSSGAFVTNEVITHINSHSLGFGGVGASGYGRHGGYEGYKNFSNRKSLLIKGPAPAMVAGMLVPPYSPRIQGFLRNWGLFLLTTNWSKIAFYLKLFVGTWLVAVVYWFFFTSSTTE